LESVLEVRGHGRSLVQSELESGVEDDGANDDASNSRARIDGNKEVSK
jgi:hypothetical protein